MSDCPNAEMRDQLPDLVHERLDERARAAVMAHVEGCVDCHGELALLREARIALSPSSIVPIDVASIARVVVERTRTPVLEFPRRHVGWSDWRIAASIAVLALGAGAMAITHKARQAPSDAPVVASTPGIVRTPNVGASTTIGLPVGAERARPKAVASERGAELSAAGGVSDLSERDLQSLLESLNDIDAVPSTEPEPVTVRVSLPETGSLE